MILLWSERKLLARIVFYLNFLSNTVSLVIELSLRFLCSGHCLEQFIIADSAKQFRLRMRSSLFYDSPSSFSVYSFARLRIKEVRISEVLLYIHFLKKKQCKIVPCIHVLQS